MGRASTLILAAFASLALLASAACRSEEAATEEAVTEEAATEWATVVCAALVPWRDEITALNAEAQRRVAAAATPAQARDGLLELLSGAEEATAAAHAAVVAAGTPRVAGGADVAEGFAASLEGARAAYARARTDMAALSTADPVAFYDGVTTVLARLQAEYTNAAIQISSLQSEPLRAAFNEVDQCR